MRRMVGYRLVFIRRIKDDFYNATFHDSDFNYSFHEISVLNNPSRPKFGNNVCMLS